MRRSVEGIYLDRLDPDEQQVVKKLALSEKPLLPSEIISEYDDNNARHKIRSAIENLCDTYVIKQDEKKQLSHCYELFKRVVIALVKDEDR
jgi:uncharacterized FlgJ-related protein